MEVVALIGILDEPGMCRLTRVREICGQIMRLGRGDARVSDKPGPNVRRDVGGWISGPCADPPLPPVRPIPPGSSALRELLAAIVQALTLPTSDTTKDGLIYLRISRDRARLVMLTCRRLLAGREADDTDVMTAVTSPRDQASR
jgi:hypothetical protein